MRQKFALILAVVGRFFNVMSAAFLLAWSTTAAAAVVTVTFDNLTGSVVTTNYTESGFRFSPNCHYDTVTGFNGSTAMGWDGSGCFVGSVGGFNPDFLGPDQYAGLGHTPVIYVDEGGQNFTFLSVFLASGEGAFVSSSGASFNSASGAPPGFVDVTGPGWEHIQWLLFLGGGGAPTAPIDQLSFEQVPEPATSALLAFGLAGVAFFRRAQRN